MTESGQENATKLKIEISTFQITSKIISIFVIYFFIIWLTWKNTSAEACDLLAHETYTGKLENHHNFGDAIVHTMKPTNDVTKVSYRLNWFVFSIGLLLTTQDTNKNSTLHENKAGSSTLGYAIKRFASGLFFIIPAELSLSCVISARVFIHSATSFEIFKFIR